MPNKVNPSKELTLQSEVVKDLPKISQQEKQKSLQSALYYFILKNPFMGGLLQEMTIKYTEMLPTAAMCYNKKLDEFEMLLNPIFFCRDVEVESLEEYRPIEQRIAILTHEILHFTHQHLFRFSFEGISDDEKKINNIAMDMAINQFIQGLPKGGVDVKDWKLDDGKPFPLFQTAEVYRDLLKSQNNKNNQEKMKGYKKFDDHEWEQLTEEEKQAMLAEAKKLIKRTIEKTVQGFDNVPDSIKDLLEDIEVQLDKMNYKNILKRAIKKTIASIDRDHTWNRKNKRYGQYSPGTTLGLLPKIEFFTDSSGSISTIELNSFLRICDEFLKVGSKLCKLHFWHTSLYHSQKYRVGQKIVKECLESGGTDPNCVLNYIVKTKPNLSIILTDGYYDQSSIKVDGCELIFIISDGGQMEHPLKNLGRTISLKKLLTTK